MYGPTGIKARSKVIDGFLKLLTAWQLRAVRQQTVTMTTSQTDITPESIRRICITYQEHLFTSRAVIRTAEQAVSACISASQYSQ